MSSHRDLASSALHIRLATPDDDFAIGELLVEAFVGRYAEKMPEVVVTEHRKRDLRDVAGKRERGLIILVAELEGRIVGSLTLFPPGSPGSEAWLPDAANIKYVGIAPGYGGAGISDALMDEAERLARDRFRCDAVCLHVRRGAHGVARFYERRGYDRVPEADRDRLPEIFLEARLLRIKTVDQCMSSDSQLRAPYEHS